MGCLQVISLTLIGFVTALSDPFALNGSNHTSELREFISPFDIDLFDYDAQGEKQESDTDKDTSPKRQSIPDQGHNEVSQKVIEV